MRAAGRGRVAIIGAGIAGATCARALADAGHAVQLFDKSRGVGGRMATRRARWSAAGDVVHESSFDHGAPGFTAHAKDFVQFVEQARRNGSLKRWTPVVAPGSDPSVDGRSLWIATPDMPSLCRALLADVPVKTGCSIDGLRRQAAGWTVDSAGGVAADGFSAVVVAIPPQQAAPLIHPHRSDWAQRAQAWPMVPGWTLMGVTTAAPMAAAWDVAWPTQGPLCWIIRNGAKPERERLAGLDHWVVHAAAEWSQAHLESSAAEVQVELQQALARWLGRSLNWHHSVAHRWRYAAVSRAAVSVRAADRCWWDASLGLGVCGDALGGLGVEGAWTSGRALAAAITERDPALPSRTGLPALST